MTCTDVPYMSRQWPYNRWQLSWSMRLQSFVSKDLVTSNLQSWSEKSCVRITLLKQKALGSLMRWWQIFFLSFRQTCFWLASNPRLTWHQTNWHFCTLLNRKTISVLKYCTANWSNLRSWGGNRLATTKPLISLLSRRELTRYSKKQLKKKKKPIFCKLLQT